MLSPADVAEELGVSLSSAYAYMREMPCARVGKHLRVSRKDLNTWIAERIECRSRNEIASGTRAFSSEGSGKPSRRSAETDAPPSGFMPCESEPPPIQPISPRTRRRIYHVACHPELRPLYLNGELGEPQALTCQNAVAASYGMTGAEYKLQVES